MFVIFLIEKWHFWENILDLKDFSTQIFTSRREIKKKKLFDLKLETNKINCKDNPRNWQEN